MTLSRSGLKFSITHNPPVRPLVEDERVEALQVSDLNIDNCVVLLDIGVTPYLSGRAFLVASQEEDSIFNCCCISYGFKARVRRPGILNFNRKSSKLIDVLVKPQEPKVGAPVMVGPSTKVVETLKSGFGKARENGRSVLALV